MKKMRVRKKLKLSVGQRKNQKEFIHNKSQLIKGKKYCKRKIANMDSEECVPKKVQILDMEYVDEELVSKICTTESNFENEHSGKIVQSVRSCTILLSFVGNLPSYQVKVERHHNIFVRDTVLLG